MGYEKEIGGRVPFDSNKRFILSLTNEIVGSGLLWSAGTCHRFLFLSGNHTAKLDFLIDPCEIQSGDKSPHSKVNHYRATASLTSIPTRKDNLGTLALFNYHRERSDAPACS